MVEEISVNYKSVEKNNVHVVLDTKYDQRSKSPILC